MTLAVAMSHSVFDSELVGACVRRAKAMGGLTPKVPDAFANYETFTKCVPIMDRSGYRQLAASVFSGVRLERFVIGASSGTSGKPSLVLSRSGVRKGQGGQSDTDLVERLKHAGVFQPGDVVANLFAVEQFSVLHHGACRLLEGCGVDIVPIGRLESGRRAEAQLALLAELKVNVLFGTPSSIVQIANAISVSSLKIPICRVAFTGENLGNAKRRWVGSVLGDSVQFFGLYGLSECGFVALSREAAETYVVREGAYFVEIDDASGLLVTSLDSRTPVPIVRYATGDSAVLERQGNECILRQIVRTGVEFNYMGNIVSYDAIKNVAAEVIGHRDFAIQVQLTTDDEGTDVLGVRILQSGDLDVPTDRIGAAIREVPELREGEEKGVGRIVVSLEPWQSAAVSARQKEALVIDNRFR